MSNERRYKNVVLSSGLVNRSAICSLVGTQFTKDLHGGMMKFHSFVRGGVNHMDQKVRHDGLFEGRLKCFH